jgi:hypothetical protein
MKRENRKSLTFLIAMWTGLALVVSMGVCIGTQILLHPDRPVVDVLLHCAPHVLLMGLLLYTACILTVRRVLLRPVNEIFLHLYNVHDGHVEALHLDGGSREVQTIVDGINTMIWQMEQQDEVRRRLRAAEER